MDQLRGHVELIILAIVSAKPSYGYEVIKKARLRSDGVFDFGEGAVYPVLYKLEASGLLRSRWADVAGRRRRVYRITPAGRAELRKLRADWRRVVGGMQGVLAES